MGSGKSTSWFKRIAIVLSFFIVVMILWNTYSFFTNFKKEERGKMEIFAAAIKEIASNKDLNANMNLELKIFENITNIPAIMTNEHGTVIEHHNLDPEKSKSNLYLQRQLDIMAKQNEPIKINYSGRKELIYYRNSDLLYKLTYYPIALLLILCLFIAVVYLFFNSNKIAEQNKLWTGMAKETAHQIGTPLSSLLGWIAILRAENISEKYVDEIENDVKRLNTIANRFSKIGSLPTLSYQNIVTITRNTFDYLERRSSKQISFSFTTTNSEILANLNDELYGWVIENLLKNAIDAMLGKGELCIAIEEDIEQELVIIRITDTGKGIPKSKFRKVFNPGFTSKKRGWGLGLSLSKRIIEDYHNGRIFVQRSELNKGTTFEIQLESINLNS